MNLQLYTRIPYTFLYLRYWSYNLYYNFIYGNKFKLKCASNYDIPPFVFRDLVVFLLTIR